MSLLASSSAAVAPLVANGGSIGLLQFQASLQTLSQNVAGAETSVAEHWSNLQRIYGLGMASPMVRGFIDEVSWPGNFCPTGAEELQEIIGGLRQAARLGPIARNDPIAQNSYHWSRRPAVRQGRRNVTYHVLDKRADVIGTFLSGCLKDKSKRVAIFFSRNRTQTFEITLGARRAGVGFTNFHSYLSAEEFMGRIQDSPYKVIFIDSESLLKIEPYLSLLHAQGKILIDINSHHPEALSYGQLFDEIERPEATTPDSRPVHYPGPTMYSSGTTGDPKLIDVRREPSPGATGINQFFGINERDRNLVVGQLYHGAAYSFARGHLNRGAEVFLTERPGLNLDREAVAEALEKQKITNFWIAPPWLHSLCLYLDESDRSFDFSSLRAVFVAASPFLPVVKRAGVKRFGPIIWEYYGSMEFGLISLLRPDDLLRRPETVGTPAPGVDVEIRDEDGRPVPAPGRGRVYVRNEFTGRQYRPSDDYGFLDEDGFLTILGRTVEKIEMPGHVLFPRPLENAVLEMPGVREAHVLDVLHENRTRLVVAVVPKAGHRLEEGDVLHYLLERGDMARYLEVIPRVFFVSSIPRTPYKTNVRVLREVISQLWSR